MPHTRQEIKQELREEGEKVKRQLKAIKPSRWIILGIMLTITVLSFVFYDYLFSDNPHVNVFLDESTITITEVDGVQTEDWSTATPNTGSLLLDKVVLHVPTLIKSIQSITIVWTISTIIVLVVSKAFHKTQRAITVSSLIVNMINWITAIIFVVILLANFDVDTTAIITGAGVLTLVVGLGLQSLIADVVAGLFIVFEDQFNVGDYITIDDFRGKVISIGIRTTKVIDGVNNIKIFNNNSIQGVINHDKALSVAKTYIDIEYGSRVPEVEKIIREHVGKLTIPKAVGVPEYQGVSALGASGVTLLFTVTCHEQDIFGVTRALNGAIKNMFDENGIGIPFPQVVVHNGDK
ncbi:MAG: mechanosensitive ion channel family protein [Clostridiales bacterium]|nr:mechanosensitive ion channel family protein [Clostridiales bacterium]